MNQLQRRLGANIRRLRRARALSQTQFAEQVGRSPDLISRIERGATAPSFETLEKISDTLGVSAAGLFDPLATGEADADPAQAELFDLITAMSANERAWALAVLRLVRSRPR